MRLQKSDLEERSRRLLAERNLATPQPMAPMSDQQKKVLRYQAESRSRLAAERAAHNARHRARLEALIAESN